MVLGLCDCCHENPAIGIAAVPGVPMSIAWCRTCLEAEVAPYEILVANTACCGGIEATAEWWSELVKRSLSYHKKILPEFLEDVAKALDKLEGFSGCSERSLPS